MNFSDAYTDFTFILVKMVVNLIKWVNNHDLNNVIITRTNK